MSHLATAFAAFIAASKKPARDFAQAIGIGQATISRVASGERPAVDTLHAMCTKWPDQRATLGLLVAHLRDEIDRAGRDQTEITVEADGFEEADIQLLARVAKDDPDLKAILHHFAQMIRGHKKPNVHKFEVPVSEPMVAEDPPKPYPDKK